MSNERRAVLFAATGVLLFVVLVVWQSCSAKQHFAMMNFAPETESVEICHAK